MKDARGRNYLLVDIGNSRLKWRYWGVSSAQGTCPLSVLNHSMPSAWRSLPVPDAILVSQVKADATRDALCRWSGGHWNLAPRFVDSLERISGLENRYADPAQLGVDRWLAAIAASRSVRGGSAVVVDCGTAITMDLVDRHGVFHGGMILPGRRLLERVFCERVPYLDLASSRPVRFPADNTADAIALGIQTALVASLDGFIENSRAKLGESPGVHLTGGDGRWLRSLIAHDAIVHDNLVLDGLQILTEFDS